MKVIICGAGQVGIGIAEQLAAEGNDVSIIDVKPELVQRANDMLDVRATLGNGAHPSVLEQAGANDADMLIAVTLSDEVNMVACHVAHTLFDIPTKIARVRAQSYFASEVGPLFSRKNLAIDYIISPEVEVGDMVLRRLELPGAFESLSFGDGKVQAIGIACDEDCPVVDTPIRQLSELFPDLPAVIVAVVRNGTLFVPHQDEELKTGDDVYVIVRADQVVRTLKIFGHEESLARKVVIAGGGNIGFYVARALETRATAVRAKVIEANRARAIEISEALSRTVVLHGSALSEDILREAEVQSADTMVTLTNDDQVNILASMLATHLGCKRSLSLINNSTGYTSMVRSFGIEAQINPRAITVSRILQFVRRGRIRTVHSVHNGAGELIEAEALETAQIIGKTIRQLDLDGVRFGAILRDGRVLAPAGSTEIEPKDRIILFAQADQVRFIEQLFQVSPDYF